jgi:hypothetical protein
VNRHHLDAGDAQRAVHVYNQLLELLKALRKVGSVFRSRRREQCSGDLITRYNVLWDQTESLVGDPELKRVVGPFWTLNRWLDRFELPKGLYVAIGLLVVCGIALLLLFEENIGFTTAGLGVLGLGLFCAAVVHFAFPHGSLAEVEQRTNALLQYLQDHCTYHYPDEIRGLPSSDDRASELEQGMESLNLDNAVLKGQLVDARKTIRELRMRLDGLETPSQFEVEPQILDKLDPLERAHLLETAQAFRVNAWTPTAAACGMLLEGRLLRLCREKGLPGGGMNAMISSLGDAGHLRGYHEQLARVGEFFRHKAAHPTSERFDRDKTTLVLTSLIILIRELS